MSEETKTTEEQKNTLLRNVEDQISDLIRTFEEQDAQVWAYLIGGVVALLVGLLAAYLYAQSIRERRKTRLERVKDALRGGVGR
jgi:hypothetical protein